MKGREKFFVWRTETCEWRKASSSSILPILLSILFYFSSVKFPFRLGLILFHFIQQLYSFIPFFMVISSIVFFFTVFFFCIFLSVDAFLVCWLLYCFRFISATGALSLPDLNFATFFVIYVFIFHCPHFLLLLFFGLFALNFVFRFQGPAPPLRWFSWCLREVARPFFKFSTSCWLFATSISPSEFKRRKSTAEVLNLITFWQTFQQ